MIQEITKKFDKIEHKIIFYTEVFQKTGTAVSTIRAHWFNKSQGISIPEAHIETVNKCLDKCLAFESEERKVYAKYFA